MPPRHWRPADAFLGGLLHWSSVDTVGGGWLGAWQGRRRSTAAGLGPVPGTPGEEAQAAEAALVVEAQKALAALQAELTAREEALPSGPIAHGVGVGVGQPGV